MNVRIKTTSISLTPPSLPSPTSFLPHSLFPSSTSFSCHSSARRHSVQPHAVFLLGCPSTDTSATFQQDTDSMPPTPFISSFLLLYLSPYSPIHLPVCFFIKSMDRRGLVVSVTTQPRRDCVQLSLRLPTFQSSPRCFRVQHVPPHMTVSTLTPEKLG